MQSDNPPAGSPDYDVVGLGRGARFERCAGKVGATQLLGDPATAEA